jgi:3-phenylpropionate/trans-cinnamate dioxygenase ferredoxin reductase subunit
MTSGIVIIGAGYCGASAAVAARDSGYAGPITIIGNETSAPYERPLLSKWVDDGPAERPIFSASVYSEKDIELRLGEHVAAIDRAQSMLRLHSGKTVVYDRLLIATGANARRIDPNLLPQTDERYLRSLTEAQSLSKDIQPGAYIVIVGGGFIGLELAASFALRGAHIHVIEEQDRILARALPPEITGMVQTLHRQHGVTILTSITMTAFNDGVATLSNGQTIKADHIIVGIGSIANSDLAEAAGLAVDNGIVVDARHATIDPDIFAAGDCCTSPLAGTETIRLESWQAAGDQGRRAGQIMAGGQPDATALPWFWSDQFDYSLQVTGTGAWDGLRTARHLSHNAIVIFDQNEGGQINCAAAFGPDNSIGRDIKLAQKIIEARIKVTPDRLSDPGVTLKSILKGT